MDEHLKYCDKDWDFSYNEDDFNTQEILESIHEKESSNNKNDEDKLINLIFSIDGERKILFRSNLKELTDNAIKKFLDQYE